MPERFCVAPPSTPDAEAVEVPSLRSPAIGSIEPVADGGAPWTSPGSAPKTSQAAAAAGLFFVLLGLLGVVLGAVMVLLFR